MKQQILAWLQSPRVYLEGVALYDRFGFNKQLKNVFAKGNNETTMETLVYELGQLTGLSELDIKKLPRVAKVETVQAPTVEVPVATKQPYIDDLILALADSFHISVDSLFIAGGVVGPANDEQLKAIEALAPAYAQVPETMKKVIRIRETYSFLKDETCPVELKLLVHDMFSAYDRYRDAYAKLNDKNAQDENLRLAAEVVENYLDNRAMWEELDYYKENGTILGKHEMFDLLKMRAEIAAIDDMELISKLNKTKPNITKAKTALAKADTDEKKTECLARLDKWTTYVAELEAEIDRRKK
jgi:hypothetical protein